MSLKLVELQVALPRTQDAGKLSEQLQKQNQYHQDLLAAVGLKQEELKRKRISETEELQKMHLKKENKSDQDDKKENELKSEDNDERLMHPYLGNHIDFNG
ncbi:hypothetical protein [Oceanobacillus bengalensis]|uniref:RNA polymerase subunit sigma n=1 Tax=Oceanobacillus bengalensis TaxID=1435466 RepID=A0A494Z4C0_9BACI|nr:hypothetical protein [Oceanobacillus bengalensis]RKQ17347.1 hypothetical protein D8M05_04780 [Oceanobacillus bengalensis]